MRRIAILAAAAIGSLVASSSFAAFTFTVSPTPIANGNTRYDVFALNDGTPVGTNIPAGTTKVQAIQFRTVSITGGTFKFRFAGGSVDLYNSNGAPLDPFGDGTLFPNNNSSIALAPAPGDNTYQNVTFTPPVVDAASSQNVMSFTVDTAATSNAPLATIAANTGRGARVASLVATTGALFTISGNIAAESGTAVPYTFNNLGGVGIPEPTSIAALAGAAGLGLIRRRK